MPRYDMELQSEEYGGVTTLTVSGGANWSMNTNNTLRFDRLSGGSGGENVPIANLTVSPVEVSVNRNYGDGTHFIIYFGIETNDNEVSVTINNSHFAGAGVQRFVKLTRPGIDSISHNNIGPSTQNIRLI